MTACARIINVACHSTVDGIMENNVQDREQAVAMATKHAKSQIRVSKKSLFECTLLLISIDVTARARVINVTCHSTVNGVSENNVQDRAQAVAMARKPPEL